jgi:hypothetical protein
MLSSDIICETMMIRTLGCHFEYSNYLKFYTNDHLSTSLYDKRDDCNIAIINIPHLDSNIPTSPAYGVYISQVIRSARALYSDVFTVFCFFQFSSSLSGPEYYRTCAMYIRWHGSMW